MCLSVPAKVLEVRGEKALVRSRGWTREVATPGIRCSPGEYLLVQGGMALGVISTGDAEEMLRAHEELDDA